VPLIPAEELDVHDAASVSEEIGDRGRAGIPCANEIDVDHQAPLGRRGRLPCAARHHTGVGHRGVEAAEFGDTGVDHGPEAIGVSDICDCRHRPPVPFPDELRRLVEVSRCGGRVVKAGQRSANVNENKVGAPSARRQAWLRPMPRAAPVISTRFPSTRPTSLTALPAFCSLMTELLIGTSPFETSTHGLVLISVRPLPPLQ
jgi:hypothetical protein